MADPLDPNDTFVCHFRGDKISEFWLLSEDEAAVDEFLGVIGTPRR